MKVGSKEYFPKISISVIGRYASSKGISLAQMDKLLNNLTMDDLVSLFVYAANKEGEQITDDDVYNEIDDRAESLAELAQHISDQLGGGEQKPERSGRTKKLKTA